MGNCGLGASGGEAAAELIVHTRTLSSLHLGNNAIGPEAGCDIARAVAVNRWRHQEPGVPRGLLLEAWG
jgi:Ran GTPase-activating protein (RanGAP) involved in mRNA processing and transport